jgi:hypothetical protein
MIISFEFDAREIGSIFQLFGREKGYIFVPFG